MPGLDELEVPALARLPERLAATAGWPARFALVDATLRGLLDASRMEPDPAVAPRLGPPVGAAGRVPVADLAGRAGLEPAPPPDPVPSPGRPRPDRRGPRACASGTPHGCSSRRRARTACPRRHASPTWPRRCGFADHSHLVREFRALAGCTPSTGSSASDGPGGVPGRPRTARGPVLASHAMDVFPTLRYADPDAAIALLRDAFGFTAVQRRARRCRRGPARRTVLGRGRRADRPAARRRRVRHRSRRDLRRGRRPGRPPRGEPSPPAREIVMDLVDQPYGSREYAASRRRGQHLELRHLPTVGHARLTPHVRPLRWHRGDVSSMRRPVPSSDVWCSTGSAASAPGACTGSNASTATGASISSPTRPAACPRPSEPARTSAARPCSGSARTACGAAARTRSTRCSTS